MKRLRLCRTAAVVLAMQIGLAWAGGGTDDQGTAEPVRTAKERLKSKALDEQRVDNCKVPVELRGPKSRPDCRERPAASPTH